MMPIKILGINGSPRAKNNTSYMLDRALKGAASVKNVEIQTYNFSSKDFNGCRGSCVAYCMKNGKCCIQDDFNNFLESYLSADGLIWAAPTYHAGPPSQVKAATDRLGNVLFSFLKGNMPRFNKSCGAITNGSSRWGGQELTVQFFLESIVQLKCIPVPGDSPKSNMAVIGYAPTWEPGSILEDTVALDASENLGVRVAEMTKIVKAGIEHYREELPKLYFPEEVISARRAAKDAKIDMAWQNKK